MSSKLSYRLIYSSETFSDKYINYFYSDNKIHFKFLDIGCRAILRGFESKLSYLMTYLFNFSFAPSILYGITNEPSHFREVVGEFLKSDDVLNIQHSIQLKLGDFKGFKALLNKKNTERPFGEMAISIVPLEKSSTGMIARGSLKSFTDKLKISLLDFLFNDGYEVEIYNSKDINQMNDKFIKKSIKKHNKITANRISLW